jgi:hypothetical protein
MILGKCASYRVAHSSTKSNGYSLPSDSFFTD